MRTTSAFSLVAASLVLGGCATTANEQLSAQRLGYETHKWTPCRTLLGTVRAAVASHNSGDAESVPIRGFPFLRANRVLAKLGARFEKNPADPAFAAWIDRLRALDREATQIELANLPRRVRSRLLPGEATAVHGRGLAQALEKCAAAAKAAVLASARQRAKLLAAVHVAEDYSDGAQAVGLFPLTSIPVGIGWENWKRDNLKTFAQQAVDDESNAITYLPAARRPPMNQAEVQSVIARSRDRHLGIPEPSTADQVRLLATFAPIWRIDTGGAFDLPGYPVWRDSGAAIAIDQRRPTVFTRTSHTIVEGKVLLQLVYTIWFSERPKRSAVDLLGGKLDGVIWRVTLGSDGRPLIYDSIHACGCYHLLFPTAEFRKRFGARANARLKEVPAVINRPLELRRGRRVMLHLASATHYLSNVSITAGPVSQSSERVRYKMVAAKMLRSLPASKGERRSMYRPDGLVAGSERLERFVLWPTGVQSPGAMRQWGRHAIAFVDRRHFDDADLFHQIFGN